MTKKIDFFDNIVGLQGISANGSLGSSGYALTSNGSGGLYWSSIASTAGAAFTGAVSITTPDQTGFAVIRTDDGNTGPVLNIQHLTASPAVNDIIGQVSWIGRDAALATPTAAAIRAVATDVTSGALSSTFAMVTRQAGTLATRASIGSGMFMAGTTDQGSGTINATNFFDDGVNINTIYGSLAAENVFTLKQTINLNTSTAASPGTTGVTLHLSGSDGVATRLWLDSYGVATNYTARRANGTNATKTALLAADVIMNNSAFGYDGTAYSTSSRGAMQIRASQNWAVGVHGTRLVMLTTADNTTTQTERWVFEQDGSLIYSGGSATGNGTVNAIDYFDNGTNINTIYLASASYTAADVLSKLLTVDGPSSGLDADLLDGKNTGTSGNVVGLLDGNNTYSGTSTFTGAATVNVNASTQFTVQRTDEGASGAQIDAIHVTTTQAVNDSPFTLRVIGRDSTNTATVYGRLRFFVTNVTDTTEAGYWQIAPTTAGAETAGLIVTGTTITFNSVAIPTISSTDTLSNKTLSSPTLSGTVGGSATWSGTQTMSALTARATLTTAVSGTLTSAHANISVELNGNVTLNNSVFTAGDKTVFDPGTSNRTFTRGAGVTMYVNGTDSATATLAANQIGSMHWRSASVVILSGAFT